LPEGTLAVLFTSSRSTIRRAIDHTRQLLDQHGAMIEPATPTVLLADLITKIKTTS
jgi:hypothetical protein